MASGNISFPIVKPICKCHIEGLHYIAEELHRDSRQKDQPRAQRN